MDAEKSDKTAAETAARLVDASLVYHTLKQQTLAVEHCSFEIEKGEFVALVGPSGCGKTSVLSLLAGIIEPTGGRVEVMGKKPDPRDNITGYMLQRDHLLDWRTIEDNVLLGLEVKGELNGKTREYALELLEKCALSDFRRHYPRQLSGGMRQKAALVRTLAFSPEILLLDEPFSALDYQTRLIIASDVHGIIKRGGYTSVLVTHDISEAIALGDRILVFTDRPARVKKEIVLDFPKNGDGENPSPLERRAMPQFNEYFDLVWRELERRRGE